MKRYLVRYPRRYSFTSKGLANKWSHVWKKIRHGQFGTFLNLTTLIFGVEKFTNIKSHYHQCVYLIWKQLSERF